MKNIFKIIRISKPLHGVFAVVSFFVLLLAVLQQITPLTLKVIVDEITQQLQTGDGSLQRLSFWLGVIFVINVLSIILNAVNQRIGDYLASRLGKYLTEYYYRKIFTLPQNILILSCLEKWSIN